MIRADDAPVLLEIKKLEVLATRFGIGYLRRTHSDSICPLQCEALLLLSRNGGSMGQKELECRMVVRKSTLSSILDTMERNGMIERTTPDEDRRRRTVVLTAKGGDECERASSELRDMESVALEGVSPEDLDAFFRVSERMRTNMQCSDYRDDTCPSEKV